MTLAVVVLSATALALFDVALSGSQDSSYVEDFWQSLLRVLDPGTMAGDVGWGRRLLALLITVFGLLVAGTLIGVIAAGVEDRIERMRRGRSVVFEAGHVVVLGASDRLPQLIRQLLLARAQRENSVIVVLADRDPAEMQEKVRRAVDDLRGSRLVFRSGDPTHLPDLDLVRLDEAEMVVILGDEDVGDPRTIRTVVAVKAKMEEFDTVPIIVELVEEASAERLVRAYGDGVHPFVPALAVSRIATVALREPGVGQVAIALLDDRDSDVHVRHVPSLEGRRFSEIVEAFRKSRPIGIMRSDGSTELNPSPETRFGRGDGIVLISDSPDELPIVGESDSLSLQSLALDAVEVEFERPEQHLLVSGWSDLGASMLDSWAHVATSSSSAEVLVDPAISGLGAVSLPEESGPTFSLASFGNLSDITERLTRPPRIDTIILCAHPGERGEEEADSRTLLHLAGIRQALRALEGPHPRVIAEILDVDNIPLADMPNSDDLVVSDAMAGQLIAQLAEQPERRRVFLELYEDRGASIHLVGAGKLGLTGWRDAGDIYATAYRAGLLAIGWRRPGSRGAQLVLNPERSQQVDLEEGDQIIVIG